MSATKAKTAYFPSQLLKSFPAQVLRQAQVSFGNESFSGTQSPGLTRNCTSESPPSLSWFCSRHTLNSQCQVPVQPRPQVLSKLQLSSSFLLYPSSGGNPAHLPQGVLSPTILSLGGWNSSS